MNQTLLVGMRVKVRNAKGWAEVKLDDFHPEAGIDGRTVLLHPESLMKIET